MRYELQVESKQIKIEERNIIKVNDEINVKERNKDDVDDKRRKSNHQYNL